MTANAYIGVSIIFYILMTLNFTNDKIDKYITSGNNRTRVGAIVVANIIFILMALAWLPLLVFSVFVSLYKRTMDSSKTG